MSARPTHWQMIRETIERLGGKATYTEIRDYICDRYGSVNRSAMTANIITCTVNHPSRIHYPQNRRPRLANSRYDFLYRIGRGRIELYDPERHGEWEIRSGGEGDVVVALVGGRELPTRGGSTAPVTPPVQELVVRIPSREAFLEGVQQYEKREKRDAMYKVATFVVSEFWGNPPDVADGLGVLLLTWNQAFYRYGMFDFDKLEKCITDNLQPIETFRNRDISSLARSDENRILGLFEEFLDALRIDSGKSEGKKSPVAVAKALHLLAPSFFPIWDQKIARAYGCHYSSAPAQKYLHFCGITKDIAEVAREYTTRSDKTLVKLIDEYNYSKFTRGWV